MLGQNRRDGVRQNFHRTHERGYRGGRGGANATGGCANQNDLVSIFGCWNFARQNVKERIFLKSLALIAVLVEIGQHSVFGGTDFKLAQFHLIFIDNDVFRCEIETVGRRQQGQTRDGGIVKTHRQCFFTHAAIGIAAGKQMTNTLGRGAQFRNGWPERPWPSVRWGPAQHFWSHNRAVVCLVVPRVHLRSGQSATRRYWPVLYFQRAAGRYSRRFPLLSISCQFGPCPVNRPVVGCHFLLFANCHRLC